MTVSSAAQTGARVTQLAQVEGSAIADSSE